MNGGNGHCIIIWLIGCTCALCSYLHSSHYFDPEAAACAPVTASSHINSRVTLKVLPIQEVQNISRYGSFLSIIASND